MTHTENYWTEDELLAEVNRVYPLLTANNKRVTQQMIADEIDVAITTLKGHKKVYERLAEIVAENYWTEDELLAEVNRVYPLLVANYKRITQQMIADEIGVTPNTLNSHKKVCERLAEIAAENYWTEGELLAEVNRVYPVLVANNKRVTGQMIANEIDVTITTLRGHKKVRERLAEIAAENYWTEDELLAEVNRVYPLLRATNKRVTQLMIAYEIGVTRDTLLNHKRVREHLVEIVAGQRSQVK